MTLLIEKTLTREAVSAALGVTLETLRKWRAEGKFPPPDIRIGRIPRWHPSTIDAWVQAGGLLPFSKEAEG